MPLNYDYSKTPETKGSVGPGVYRYYVREAIETTYKSGNSGLKVVAGVWVDEGREVTCFTNFVYTDNSLWRLKQFFDSCGFDYGRPPEVWELTGAQGEANFKTGERGYLEVENWIPGPANNLTAQLQQQAQAPAPQARQPVQQRQPAPQQARQPAPPANYQRQPQRQYAPTMRQPGDDSALPF